MEGSTRKWRWITVIAWYWLLEVTSWKFSVQEPRYNDLMLRRAVINSRYSVVSRLRTSSSSLRAHSSETSPRVTSLIKSRVAQTEVVCQDNMRSTLLNLIRLGDQWIAGKPEQSLNIIHLNRSIGYHPVPGCMAAVRLKVDLTAPVPDAIGTFGINLSGTADSRVALGMLALLSHLLQGLPAEDVLSIPASSLASQLGLGGLLPQGRLDGFRNMLLTIQQVLRDQQLLHPLPHQSSHDSRKDEVAVLLSGGVDSSVALQLLKNEGRRVRAYYLKIWLEDEIAHLNQCPWEEDLQYATAVCEKIGVPLETLSLQKEYWQYVVQYTLEEAKRGRTPNPDIMCNSRIKFGMFYDYVGRYHSHIATGHYATVIRVSANESLQAMLNLPDADDAQRGELVLLQQSPDPVKDQSYFLSNLRQDQLQRCIFPIGKYLKEEVRKLAAEFDLPTKNRKDSQGICFLGKLKFEDFIGHYMGENHGEIRHYATGELMGKHRGLWFHTINQRKGIGLLLGPGYVHNGPWFVADKDIERNVLLVTNDVDVVDEPRRSFKVDNINWIAGPPVLSPGQLGVTLNVKIRHGPKVIKAVVYPTGSEGSFSSVAVLLSEKDKGIAPGQFAAFYLDDFCLGAGVISCTAKDRRLPIDSAELDRRGSNPENLQEVQEVQEGVLIASAALKK